MAILTHADLQFWYFFVFVPWETWRHEWERWRRRRRMRKNQSANTACSPQGTEDIQSRKHSGRSIWRGEWKTVERHVVTAGKITQHPLHTVRTYIRTHTHTHTPSTHSLSYCRLTSILRHKQNWTFQAGTRIVAYLQKDRVSLIILVETRVNLQYIRTSSHISDEVTHSNKLRFSIWKETANVPRFSVLYSFI